MTHSHIHVTIAYFTGHLVSIIKNTYSFLPLLFPVRDRLQKEVVTPSAADSPPYTMSEVVYPQKIHDD